MNRLTALFLLSFSLLLSACSYGQLLFGDKDAYYRNKRVSRTFEDFISSRHYRNSRDIWRGAALNQYNPANSYVEILLDYQRGRLYINNQIAMDFPICAGKGGANATPRGTFRISQKVVDYHSTIYGSYVDSKGRVVRSGADSRRGGPRGAHFRGASLSYWMRFNGAIGMHVGSVYRVGVSHGCVRVPVEACPTVFRKLDIGSKVIVK